MQPHNKAAGSAPFHNFTNHCGRDNAKTGYIVYPGLRSRMLVVHGSQLLIEVGAMCCLAAASVTYVCAVIVIIVMWHLEQILWWCRKQYV